MTTKRAEHLRPVIISRPELQSRRQRAMFSVITAAAWAVWGYLFLPFFSAVAWWLGLDLFAQYMLRGEGHYLGTLTVYAGVVGLAAVAIVSWSLYNRRRFGGADLRKALPPVTDDMLIDRFGVSPATLQSLRSARVMTVTMDPTGAIVDVAVGLEQPDTMQRLQALGA